MSVCENYKKLLIEIYGEKAVQNLIEGTSALKLKTPEKINQFLGSKDEIPYRRANNEGCQTCKNSWPVDFDRRKMDFPSWIGELTSKGKPVMLIGEDVSPKIKGDLNIAYSLGRYEINSEGRIEEDKRNLLWARLKEIFKGQENYERSFRENLYITDICKCNAQKNRTIWDMCSKKYLLAEIKLIKPRVLIFQGSTAYDFTKSLAQSEGWTWSEEVLKNSYTITDNFPKMGKIQAEGNEIVFLKMLHSSAAANGWWTGNYKKIGQLFNDRIIPILK